MRNDSGTRTEKNAVLFYNKLSICKDLSMDKLYIFRIIDNFYLCTLINHNSSKFHIDILTIGYLKSHKSII